MTEETVNTILAIIGVGILIFCFVQVISGFLPSSSPTNDPRSRGGHDF